MAFNDRYEKYIESIKNDNNYVTDIEISAVGFEGGDVTPIFEIGVSHISNDWEP